MTFPKEQMREKEKEAKTLEGRFARKFDDLQMAREMRNPTAFDELGRSIEILFKAIPRLYTELIEEKEKLDAELETVFEEIQERAESANDVVSREAILNNRSYQAQWAYRESYEELLIDLLQKYGLISIKNPKYSSIESDASTAVTEEPEEIESIEKEEEKPKKKPKKKSKKKPKLSIKRKKKKEQTNFDI